MKIEHYCINRSSTKTGEVSFALSSLNKAETDAIKTPNRLVYVVHHRSNILYVGEAKKELITRLSRGFVSFRSFKRNGKKRNGYGGYKWIDLFTDKKGTGTRLDELNLTAAVFDESYSQHRDRVEAVEGELVHLIKRKTGKWPLFQNEIHFNNDFKEAESMAAQIYKAIAVASECK